MSPLAKWHRSKPGLAISISIYLHVHFILAISYNLLFFWLQEVILFPAMKPQDWALQSILVPIIYIIYRFVLLQPIKHVYSTWMLGVNSIETLCKRVVKRILFEETFWGKNGGEKKLSISDNQYKFASYV
jgi:hypothetical protein